MKRYCLNDLENWDAISASDVMIENLMKDEAIQTVKVIGDDQPWLYTDDIEIYQWYENYSKAMNIINEAINHNILSKDEFCHWKAMYCHSPIDLIEYADGLIKTFEF